MSYKLRTFEVDICDACISDIGEMCDTPGCRFFLCSMAEVRQYLSQLLIRPRCDGKLLFEEVLGEVRR